MLFHISRFALDEGPGPLYRECPACPAQVGAPCVHPVEGIHPGVVEIRARHLLVNPAELERIVGRQVTPLSAARAVLLDVLAEQLAQPSTVPPLNSAPEFMECFPHHHRPAAGKGM